MAAVVESPLAEFLSVVSGPIDLLVCCASFEGRSLSIPNEVPSNAPKRVLVVENADIPIVGENAARIHHRFRSRSEQVLVRTDDPIMTADALGEALARVPREGEGSVVVDITTFTHEHLLILLAILKTKPLGRPLKFVYTGASEYMIGDDKWLSRGIGDIRSVLGFPGMLRPSRDVHLVILVGFELERAELLASAYDPRFVSLGYATAEHSISSGHSEMNKVFHRRLADRLGAVDAFTFSSRDPVATRDAIAGQVGKYRDCGTVVAPLNTKVSTIGAALAAFGNPAIQLCYAKAMRYNIRNYSRPGDSFFMIDVPGMSDG